MRNKWFSSWTVGAASGFAAVLFLCLWAFVARSPGDPPSHLGTSADDSPVVRAGFTTAEIDWLQRHPRIRVGIDPHWPPYSRRRADGIYEGIDIEILTMLEKIMGVGFEIAVADRWSDILEDARRGRVDMLVSTAYSPQRAEYLLFSKPYADIPSAIITRTDEPFVLGLNSLRGRRVALPQGYVLSDVLEARGMGEEIIHVETVAEALLMVARGSADAYIGNLANASHIIREKGLANLKITGVVSTGFELRYAVRAELPELVPILDKAIAAIPDYRKQEIHDRWIYLPVESVLMWEEMLVPIFVLLLVVAVVMGTTLVWNLLQAREIRKRRAAEDAAQRAHQQLQNLSEEKVQLMNMAVHDMRNPLAGILANADLINMQEDAGPDTKRCASEVRTLALRLDRLIRQLADVCELEEGRYEFILDRIELNDITGRVVSGLQGRARTKRITLEFIASQRLLPVRADIHAVEQILDNLISNALKFSSPDTMVLVRVMEDENGRGFDVEDEGPGISTHEIPKLYDKFTKLSPRPTAGETSTGLGMSIVKYLVEGMGGTVDCRSQVGTGTVFKIRFLALD